MRVLGKLWVVAVGKVRSACWREAQAAYLRRLRRYADVQLIEVRDRVGRGLPDAVAVRREGDALLRASASARRRFALAVEGTLYDSRTLAAFLRRQVESFGSLAFLIGGPVGLAPEVTAACDGLISLSPLTFPHELARLMLLEQLYRAATILSGEPYHK